MEILLTGFTAFLTQEWIETAFPDDHVLTTHTKGESLLDTRIKTVMLESKQLLDQLAETYQFDRVVYFSEYLLPHGNQEGELDRLRRVLQSCREREVELLYLSGPEAALTPSSGKTLLANAAEELCFHYAKTSKLQVKVFRLPYLYAVSASGAEQFARLFEQISAGTVQMDEQAAQPLLALCAEELADLVARVFDTWTPKPERFTLPDVFGNTQEQLGEVLQKLQPGLQAPIPSRPIPQRIILSAAGTAGSSGTAFWMICPRSIMCGVPSRQRKKALHAKRWIRSARARVCCGW